MGTSPNSFQEFVRRGRGCVCVGGEGVKVLRESENQGKPEVRRGQRLEAGGPGRRGQSSEAGAGQRSWAAPSTLPAHWDTGAGQGPDHLIGHVFPQCLRSSGAELLGLSTGSAWLRAALPRGRGGSPDDTTVSSGARPSQPAHGVRGSDA